jgi:transcriptional regulator with XRE-family HTH domain
MEHKRFADFVKERRLELRYSLRKFCQLLEIDPGNWSKTERGKLNLSLDDEKLKEMADLLELPDDSRERADFFAMAAIAKKEIPKEVYSDEELVDILPIFFRTASGTQPTDEELDKIIETLRRS